jgi:hypothetical protein
MSNSLNISDARARLPQIAQALVREPGSVMYIEHRDLDERLAVTTESHLRYLESMVRRLTHGSAAFSLSGSIETDLSPQELDAAIRSLRAEATDRSDEKLGSI